MWSLPAKPKQGVRVELLNKCTAGIDTNTLTTFTLLLVIQTQRYMWSLDKVGCTAKSSQQSFCHWWQNIHYHLTNLQNHITTNMLDVVRIITSKQQISQSDPILIRQLKKNCSPIQSWSGQNWLQSWSSPIQPWSVLISGRGHLNFQATCTVVWNCVKMKMIQLFCGDAARRCSNKFCFIFEMHLLVDHSEIMVYKALLKRFFSVEVEPSTSFCLNSIL